MRIWKTNSPSTPSGLCSSKEGLYRGVSPCRLWANPAGVGHGVAITTLAGSVYVGWVTGPRAPLQGSVRSLPPDLSQTFAWELKVTTFQRDTALTSWRGRVLDLGDSPIRTLALVCLTVDRQGAESLPSKWDLTCPLWPTLGATAT